MQSKPVNEQPEQSLKIHLNPVTPLKSDLTMTIKQQQIIEQILYETFSSIQSSQPQASKPKLFPHRSYPHCSTQNEIRYQLDDDLERLLKQSEIKIGEEYENMAREQLAKNRVGIAINDQHDRLKEIFQKMDAAKSQASVNTKSYHGNRSSRADSEGKAKKVFDLDVSKLKHNYDDFCINQSLSPNKKARTYSISLINFEKPSQQSSSQFSQSSQQGMEAQNVTKSTIAPGAPIVSPLQIFEREEITSPKQQSLQIESLDQKYPKINPTSMYRHQYPIFNWSQSSTSKYLKFLRKGLRDIQSAITFWVSPICKWTILAIDGMLYVFAGEDWKQPFLINPQQNSTNLQPIKCMSVSKSHNFVCVALVTEIILYSIKKESNSLVMIKNLSATNDLNSKLTNISKIIVYSENPIRIAYLDDHKNVGVIICDQGVLFMRVSEKEIKHGLKDVQDIDILVLDVPSNSATSSPSNTSKFSMKLNQKISNLMSKTNPSYLAITSSTHLSVWSLEPNTNELHVEQLPEIPKTQAICRWRNFVQVQSKPQLLLCYNNTICIYKLIENNPAISSQSNNNLVQMQMHLLYKNHYDIVLMEIISSTHLLLVSNQNIIVIAVPLIPSTQLHDANALGHQIFQSAIVFVTSQPNIRVLYTSLEECIYYSSASELLRLATLVSLQDYLNSLMLQHGHFRQAFTLLILISKGLNYSFKFSYSIQSLTQCIFTAVQCTIASLRLSMNDNIVEYRLGWICQLLVQTKNEAMIWGCVWGKITQKQREREKQWEKEHIKKQEEESLRKKNSQKDKNYEHGFLKSSKDMIKIQQSLVKEGEGEGKLKKSRLLQHHLSLNLPETPSKQLMSLSPTPLHHLLFTILELFVLKSQICSIPEHIFFQFLTYECEKQCDTVVEKAILQNKELYDGAKLLSLLQNKERNYLMLYLFSRAIVCEEPDFYTGFVKVFGGYRRIDQQGQRSSLKDNGEQRKIHSTGMLCLWYLNKCLRFQRIPEGIMPLNQKISIIQTLCIQILEPTITKKLFELDRKILLQTLILMFAGGQLCMMIQEQNELMVQKYKEYFQSIYQQIMSLPKPQLEMRRSVNQDEGQVFDKNFKQLVLFHLQKTIPMLTTQKLLWAQFQALAFYFNKVQICLTFQATIDILIIFFQHKVESYTLHNHLKSQRPSIQDLELSLIDYIKPILLQRKDRFYINKLISFNDRNVSYYLYRIDQNYRLALQHYISVKDKSKIISFIYQLLSDIKGGGVPKQLRDRKFGDIKGFLTKNIGTLFKIDKFQALNIFYEIGETSQTIYKIIEESMSSKLDFLTAVLKKSENEDFELKQRFQLEHLSQVCMLKDKQMLKYLDQFFYPLDSAILVCEQKGNLLAKAIFEQRCGKISDAFNSYERIVKNYIQSNKSRSQKSIRHNVHKYTEELLRLCKQYAYDPNSPPQHNFWLRIINFINSFIKSNIQHKVFLKVQFEKVLQHILSEMFQFLPTTLLTDFFITKGYKLELSIAKQYAIYENLFVLGRFDLGVNRKVIEICKIDIRGTRKQAFAKRKKGTVCYAICDFCKKQLKQEAKCSLYTCRHSFHKICHNDPFKCLTCYFESDNSIIKSNIFGSQLQKLLLQQQSDGANAKPKKGNDSNLQSVNIIVESASMARLQSIKKKLKVFDFTEEKRDTAFQKIVDGYKQMEMEGEKQKRQKMEIFENEYIKYSRGEGLQIKEKKNVELGEEDEDSIN